MSVEKTFFGNTENGDRIELYRITNRFGASVSVITYGATIQSISVMGVDSEFRDIVPGFADVKGYERSTAHFGATIGRCCNRIRGGEVLLNGQLCLLSKNSDGNHLHGGFMGFDRKVWTAKIIGESCVSMSYLSGDGEEGYPGNLRTEVRFSFTDDNALSLSYLASSDKDTVCNLTNHVYFNLNGHDRGAVGNHEVYIPSRQYAPMDRHHIPDGTIAETVGKRDFSKSRQVSAGVNSQCFLLEGDGLCFAGRVMVPGGLSMDVMTTMPAVQYYNGYLADTEKHGIYGKHGGFYKPYCGLCLETQYVPDAVHHSAFRQPYLRRGEKYSHTTIYRFYSDSSENSE